MKYIDLRITYTSINDIYTRAPGAYAYGCRSHSDFALVLVSTVRAYSPLLLSIDLCISIWHFPDGIVNDGKL